MESEFSHTVMHGHKLGRALPPPPKPAARPPSGKTLQWKLGELSLKNKIAFPKFDNYCKAKVRMQDIP